MMNFVFAVDYNINFMFIYSRLFFVNPSEVLFSCLAPPLSSGSG